MSQVIVINPDGSVEGLDHKRKGLDLRQLGAATIERISLVEWDEELQQWYVEFIKGPYAGRRLHSGDLIDCDPEKRHITSCHPCAYGLDDRGPWGEKPLLFTDYEDGVAMEVAVVQALQLSGREL